MGKWINKNLLLLIGVFTLGIEQVVYAQSEQGISENLFSGEVRQNYSSGSARSLKDLLFFWNADLTDDLSRPWNDEFDVSAYRENLKNSWYGKCRNKDFYYYPIQEVTLAGTAKLDDKCRPEFLYSWGNEKKLEELKSVAGKGKWAHGFAPSISDALSEQDIRVLYMGLTPASTFPYGDVMLRLKVRPDVNFINIESTWYRDNWGADCSKVPQNIKDNVIVYKYRVFDGPAMPAYQVYLEYQACSPRVFESWSHDTKYNYDEIVKDYLWMMFGESWTSEHIAYQYLVDGLSIQQTEIYSKGRFHQQSIDGAYWTKENFTQMLKVQVDRINNKMGEVFYHWAGSNHYDYTQPMWFLNDVP
ncbi:MAG TPA: hypothetical protein PKC21_04220 [Oligoflexia bacterium]|nr:hypothetical protein [Oligoflexia bacterium]HMR24544.1 hypothetical protein [Oligoflexia bacterium]